MYSDACIADGGLGAVACSANRDDMLTVLLKRAAEDVWIRSLLWTRGSYVEEMFALVPAVLAKGEQLGGKRVVLSIDNNAAAGALIKASPMVPVAWELIERFLGSVAQLSAPCWVERASSEANTAGTPQRE